MPNKEFLLEIHPLTYTFFLVIFLTILKIHT